MEDRKEIALAIRITSFGEEMECSLINKKIIYNMLKKEYNAY